MVEKGTRGGISMISNRYGKANNKYMGKSFIDTMLFIYIAYLDANNLYGWAMSKPLPTHGFKWMKVSELETWELHSCVLEVDLEYPRSLHCYVHTQLFLACTCVYLFLVSPVAIFRTGFSFVEYCSGSFRSFLPSDY